MVACPTTNPRALTDANHPASLALGTWNERSARAQHTHNPTVARQRISDSTLTLANSRRRKVPTRVILPSQRPARIPDTAPAWRGGRSHRIDKGRTVSLGA